MTRPLRVGIQLPEVERDVRWPEYLAMARAAETVGFDSIWVGDHVLYRDTRGPERGPWDAWSLLAALASITERVQLGPLVACLGFRPPGMLAKAAATVDEISGGRLVLGVGAGWNETEFRAFGLPFDHRVARFEEAFEILRKLVAGERVTMSGSYWQVNDAVVLPRPSRRPPLMVGSNGPRMLEITLPHVDSWNTWYARYGNTVEGFAALNESVTTAALRVGREPDEIERSACVFVVLDPEASERPAEDGVVPLEGNMERIAAGLRDLAEAGAHEAILVVSPITEASIRALQETLVLLDES
ncbi:MAG TPA: LLM class flavin-dependent oxidoreductase [Actinomycetota bacterium]|nr:LLM class flavin-dependent oxidoreductase [Actinomycetota bacterium]